MENSFKSGPKPVSFQWIDLSNIIYWNDFIFTFIMTVIIINELNSNRIESRRKAFDN